MFSTGFVIVMVIVIVFVLGLIVGSFLNAVIHRLHTGQSILSDRSKCASCGHKLGPLDLVPIVSFLLLGGKCRYCGKNISWQYPIVELATAVSFVLLAQNFEFRISNFEFLTQAIFISVFIIIAVYDFKHYLILDKVVFPALVLAFAWSLSSLSSLSFAQALLGALTVSGFFLLQYVFSRGRWIGFGDVKLGLLLGSVLGLSLSAAALMISYLSGAVVGLTLVASGKKQLSSKMPFGTFLAGSAIIVLLYGEKILNWYLKLIGFNES